MKRIFKTIILFLSFLLIAGSAISQSTINSYTYSKGFTNTDNLQLYQAIRLGSGSGSTGTVVMSDSVKVFDNSSDTLNNRLQVIKSSLIDGTGTPLIQITNDKLFDPIDGQNNGEILGEIKRKLNSTVTVTVSNTNLATSANQVTEIARLNGLTGNVLNANIPFTYVFEDSEASLLQDQVNAYLLGSPTEIIQHIQYTSTCYWNGITEVCKFNCFIIVK